MTIIDARPLVVVLLDPDLSIVCIPRCWCWWCLDSLDSSNVKRQANNFIVLANDRLRISLLSLPNLSPSVLTSPSNLFIQPPHPPLDNRF
jgi:hypothetical protein